MSGLACPGLVWLNLAAVSGPTLSWLDLLWPNLAWAGLQRAWTGLACPNPAWPGWLCLLLPGLPGSVLPGLAWSGDSGLPWPCLGWLCLAWLGLAALALHGLACLVWPAWLGLVRRPAWLDLALSDWPLPNLASPFVLWPGLPGLVVLGLPLPGLPGLLGLACSGLAGLTCLVLSLAWSGLAWPRVP